MLRPAPPRAPAQAEAEAEAEQRLELAFYGGFAVESAKPLTRSLG